MAVMEITGPTEYDHYVFFDLDGCLYTEYQRPSPREITWKEQQKINSHAALCSFGCENEVASEIVDKLRGSSIMRYIFDHGYALDTKENRDQFWNVYNYGSMDAKKADRKQQFSDFVKPDNDVVQFVRSLPGHYRKFVHTNGTETMARHRLEIIGFKPDEDFEYIFGAEFVHPHYKPSHESYLRVLEKLQIQLEPLSAKNSITPCENTERASYCLSHPCTFFEDTPLNLRFPRSLGMRTVGVFPSAEECRNIIDCEEELAKTVERRQQLSCVADIVIPKISRHNFDMTTNENWKFG
eukprot:GHVH01004852.1.p1 GENE.GHVH01004852.1~~GHVH01004852.1.p1  ORF type:complete len:296 (+),score=37.71 GHVH01004852.1:54-941(+)